MFVYHIVCDYWMYPPYYLPQFHFLSRSHPPMRNYIQLVSAVERTLVVFPVWGPFPRLPFGILSSYKLSKVLRVLSGRSGHVSPVPCLSVLYPGVFFVSGLLRPRTSGDILDIDHEPYFVLVGIYDISPVWRLSVLACVLQVNSLMTSLGLFLLVPNMVQHAPPLPLFISLRLI